MEVVGLLEVYLFMVVVLVMQRGFGIMLNLVRIVNFILELVMIQMMIYN